MSKKKAKLRKAVQLSTVYDSADDKIWFTALCDDGSMWVIPTGEPRRGWKRLIEIPQDAEQTND